MKYLTLLLFFSTNITFGSDSLLLTKTFPTIETKILTDTLINIRGTALDTFGFIPDIIFIVRDWEGRVIHPAYHSRFLLVHGMEFYVAGYGDDPKTANAIQLNQTYYPANTYLVKFPDRYFRQELDTIDFKTPIEPDSLNGKTYVYEIQLGRDTWHSECLVKTTKRFSKKDKESIHHIFEEQNLYGLLESERASTFYYKVANAIDPPKNKKRTLWCYCNNTPGAN